MTLSTVVVVVVVVVVFFGENSHIYLGKKVPFRPISHGFFRTFGSWVSISSNFPANLVK